MLCLCVKTWRSVSTNEFSAPSQPASDGWQEINQSLEDVYSRRGNGGNEKFGPDGVVVWMAVTTLLLMV